MTLLYLYYKYEYNVLLRVNEIKYNINLIFNVYFIICQNFICYNL